MHQSGNIIWKKMATDFNSWYFAKSVVFIVKWITILQILVDLEIKLTLTLSIELLHAMIMDKVNIMDSFKTPLPSQQNIRKKCNLAFHK